MKEFSYRLLKGKPFSLTRAKNIDFSIIRAFSK
jgi:hypothetical protein